MLTHAFSGLLAGWSIIIAVGPQNAFILRQGLARKHVGLVVAICTLADIGLIAAGNLGVGALVTAAPWALEVLRWAGALYLLYFAFQSFRSAATASGLRAGGGSDSVRTVVLTTLTITFLNPAVYLDTVAMLGTLANQSAGHAWAFSLGAMLGSVTWFAALGYGARALAPLVSSPRAWRWIDIGIGIVVTLLALRLILGA
ncbi:LysE family transporter [Brevibacterium sp. 5221]|uniref:LysE family transporter n=1 Tax=Brevibacterium rongguiense TaxID=2695267 RepID=A0A6N9H6A4_9MICO|nr:MULTISPECIES: LysE family transporter [Brevibacterium]MYM19401.1 LysE family transporter [Brevibacterium rongguiense]WAL39302.1 LysE family transporter [Brevibacterium sp. BRM-1]